MTADPRISRRVRRLAVTSAVALGLIWLLGVATLTLPPLLQAGLMAGWLLMPALLVASLSRPRLRYGLVVPATLVGTSLLAISLWNLPSDPIAAAGWLSITGGVLLGGAMGLWFWFRVLPVPAAFDEPFSAGRWALIAVHVGLVALGLTLAGVALVVEP